MKTWAPLWRQGLGYGVVGGLQLLLDWLAFVVLTAAGAPAAAANVFGRIAGAALGFCLNGAITFRVEGGRRLGWTRFWRFAASWSLMTVLSTVAVYFINAEAGLHWAWLLKPAVDIALALLGFIASRYWIYR